MIKRIRDFFCNADPIGLTFIIVVGGLYLTMLGLSGIKEFLLTIAVGLVLTGLLFAVGWVVYKIVVFAQGFCK